MACRLIDIDRFKTINDTFGHDIGDKVLIAVSARIRDYINGRAVLARLGGDEFALFVQGNYSREMVAGFADDIIKTCSLPVTVEDNKLQITISLGIALHQAEEDSRITLMRNADIAMYRAKAQGYNKYVFYDPSFIKSVGKKSEIEVLLRKANFEKDFELYYQPQFDILENKLIGAEALLRWKIAEYGYIPPKEFIPVAEEIDYMISIGKWVMNHAVMQIIESNTAHCANLKMGINISPKQIQDEDFISIIKCLVSYENFKSAWIDAEVTENVILDDCNRTSSVFDALKEQHITVSVDDFGAGYSSFDYLNKFSFDRIKIDRSLIEQLSESNTSSIQIVKAIIAMAEAIGIDVIAEGVETQEQLMILRNLNCRQAQGYYLGRPVSASEFEEAFIKSHKGTA
jgi:diguanylate cyclase (GGDEF)-like protein